MKIQAIMAVCAVVFPAWMMPAQTAPGPSVAGLIQGPRLGGARAKLFGVNTAFVANVEILAPSPTSTNTVATPGRVAFSEGKTRFDLDVTLIRGNRVPPGDLARIRSLGMDRVAVISRPDKKVEYVVFPALGSFVERPLALPDAADAKVTNRELGREAVDGQPCTKALAVVAGTGASEEATVWYATGLKNFPVKIETREGGGPCTFHFRNVSLTRPDARSFEPPAGFAKVDSVQALMQQAMARQMGVEGAVPRPGAPPRQPTVPAPRPEDKKKTD